MEGCQLEQMGRDKALPEETNYQDLLSKTNILQSNHIRQSSLHCSASVCAVLATMTWINLLVEDEVGPVSKQRVFSGLFFFSSALCLLFTIIQS